MVFLNEWLPNPIDPDAAGEFVELYNDGPAPVRLNGWVLRTGKGREKSFSFASRTIDAHGYLVLRRADTKLALRNMDGGLALYDARGTLVDQGHFAGLAPEGQSFSRVDRATTAAGHFAFADPTPGAANKAINNAIARAEYPAGVPLARNLDAGQFFVIMMGTAALLAGLIIYVAKANEDLSKLFFERDEGAR